MPDNHVHEVTLSDGVTQRTGPPIVDDGGAEEPPNTEPTQELRAPVKSKLGPVPATKVGELEREEARQAQQALDAGDASLLPGHAKSIWQRMFESSKRFTKDDRYSAALAWRAIRQKYGLQPSKKLGQLLKHHGLTLHDPPRRRKTLAAGTIAEIQSGAYLVRVSEEAKADELYERTEQIPLHSNPDVLVTVGFSPGNHRNIISVRVPKTLVSNQPGGSGPVTWVREHWEEIWKVGKGLQPSQVVSTKRRAPAPTDRRVITFKRFLLKQEGAPASYVDDPRQATERIAYGEVYVPWEVDLQGEYATEVEVEAMAHRFLAQKGLGGEMHSRWQMPDGTPAGIPVESFIARRGDPDFVSGAWVMGVKFHPEVWEKIAAGAYTGYSIGGSWGVEPVRRAGRGAN